MRSIYLLFSLVVVAASQANQTAPMQVIPANDSSHDDGPNYPNLWLNLTENGVDLKPSQGGNSYALDSAIDHIAPDSDVQNHLLRPLLLKGRLQLTTNASDAARLDDKSVGYVCCDTDAYPDANGFNNLLSAAATALGNASNTSALIFYSRSAFRCNVETLGPFTNTSNLFTLYGTSAALGLESALKNATSVVQATIGNGQDDVGNDSSAWDPANASSPGATVAMVVLYIITGLITLGFLSVIIAGAIRAHRHPEWYREWDEENGGGRRRVLGRAILDSIPIIKFGEPAAGAKKADAAEFELEEGRERPVSTVPPTERSASPTAAADVHTPCPVHSPAPAPVAAAPAPTKDANENEEIAPAALPAASNTDDAEAPECAICVEPFQKGDDMRVLPQCEHKFHPACLDPWLLNVSSTCPLCRLDLRPPSAPASSPTTASNTLRAPEDGESSEDNVLWLVPTDRPGVYLQIDPRTIGPRRPGGVRASARLSDVWTRLLSRQRLREASPAERVVALRELRAARRESESVDAAADGASMVIVEEAPEPEAAAVRAGEPHVHDQDQLGERRPPRVGDRLSRLFGRRPAFPPTEERDASSQQASPAVSPISEEPPRLPRSPFMPER